MLCCMNSELEQLSPAERALLQAGVKQVLSGKPLTRAQLIDLSALSASALGAAAACINRHFNHNAADVCAIISAKTGRCSENCRFCAQSALCSASLPTAPALPAPEDIIAAARKAAASGVKRFSLVFSGRRLLDRETESVCEIYREIKRCTPLSLCISAGFLHEAQLQALKAAGVCRVHCNVETSERFFPHICTSHSFADKIATIKSAQALGLECCSGGIFGLGESMEDRIDMGMTLAQLKIQSVPLNLLHALPGTPLEHQPPLSLEEFLKSAALMRFILPRAFLRLAGGRALIPHHGRSLLQHGVNALISGDLLTTQGFDYLSDQAMLAELNFKQV